MVQPSHTDKPLVWLLPSVRAVSKHSLPSPALGVRKSGPVPRGMLSDYKTMENIVGKFQCCRCDRRLSGVLQPRDPGKVVSRVGYHFFFLKEGLQGKVSGPRPICHFVACACLLLQSWMHWLESQISLSDSVV